MSGYTGYQELKEEGYHGYQPLKPRKKPQHDADYSIQSGMLNIAVAKDLDSIPSGDKEDAGYYQSVSAHNVQRGIQQPPANQPAQPGGSICLMHDY
uniref:Uncharacterized protein n=1 Tax=Ditylenchus dipsaci TaxID=166011 RepID=A0A915DS24_9BILA